VASPCPTRDNPAGFTQFNILLTLFSGLFRGVAGSDLAYEGGRHHVLRRNHGASRIQSARERTLSMVRVTCSESQVSSGIPQVFKSATAGEPAQCLCYAFEMPTTAIVGLSLAAG